MKPGCRSTGSVRPAGSSRSSSGRRVRPDLLSEEHRYAAFSDNDSTPAWEFYQPLWDSAPGYGRRVRFGNGPVSLLDIRPDGADTSGTSRTVGGVHRREATTSSLVPPHAAGRGKVELSRSQPSARDGPPRSLRIDETACRFVSSSNRLSKIKGSGTEMLVRPALVRSDREVDCSLP